VLDLSETVRGLCAFERRAPCSDAERRAAGWLRDELARAGHEAWEEPVWIRPQWPLVLALHAGLAVLASVLSVSAPAVGLAIALVVAASLALEASGRSTPLRAPLRRRATQVVVTEPAGREDEDAPEDAVTLLVCAAYDAPRRGLVFRDGLRRLAARAPRRAPGPLGWLILAALAVAGASGLRLLLADEPLWLGLLQFLPTVALLLALAAAIDVALSEVSPGANGDASAVAVALALHDELTADPPAELAPALLLTGAGEGVPSLAVRAHLKAERLAADRVLLLEIGPCGAGAPVVSTRHPQVRAAAAEAGLPLVALRRPTAVRAARSVRLPAARLAGLDSRGITPRLRTGDDVPERLDPEAMEAALDAALDLVEALDVLLEARRAPVEAAAAP